MALVVRADQLGEVLHHLAVAEQEKVVVDGEHVGDLGEERPHVLVAVAFAGRVALGGWPPGRAVSARDRGVDAVAHGELRAPAQDPGRAGGDPEARSAGIGHRRPSFRVLWSPIENRWPAWPRRKGLNQTTSLLVGDLVRLRHGQAVDLVRPGPELRGHDAVALADGVRE